MGEAVNLTEEERCHVIKQYVDSVKKYHTNLKVIAGSLVQSARATIAFTKQASAFGPNFALALSPSYYRSMIDDVVLVELSKHQNIIGIKDTDGDVGKMTTLIHRINPKDVSTKFFLPKLFIGAVSLIAKSGNVFLDLCVEIQRLYEEGKIDKAVQLQCKLAEADDALCRW
ncbi:uncharacterized protein B0P05DRAFT_590052 [Gilbertella persicaria]|uniref:uncharacterized protein n=1 Tax=Gilbertella persicaria TaxID=101096 RepID=UPI00221EA293|nr:uncharacterized protein B0P05DRAFT_590052 [Gilbertella persicaria]KAI8064847.1 hypothetical protein B0P05DRAFT_590052 [Gilbertella persicaria]